MSDFDVVANYLPMEGHPQDVEEDDCPYCALRRIEAELAALRARRCDNCECGDPSTARDDPDVYCGQHSQWWRSDQFCSLWAAREEMP